MGSGPSLQATLEKSSKVLCKEAIRGSENVEDIEDKMVATFKAWDKDGNGTISIAELEEVLTKLGANLSSEDINKLMAEGDTNKDGQLDFKEFVSWLFTAPQLDGYFKVLKENYISLQKDMKTLNLEFEAKKAKDGEQKARDAHGSKVLACQQRNQKKLVKELTPLIKGAFKWHDKESKGMIDKSESVIFFGNFTDKLNRYIDEMMELGASHYLDEHAGCNASELKEKMNAMVQDKRQQYFAQISVRHQRAFAAIDVNKDGRLQEKEVIEALIPGTARNFEFLAALGLSAKPIEVAMEASTSQAAPRQLPEGSPVYFANDPASTASIAMAGLGAVAPVAPVAPVTAAPEAPAADAAAAPPPVESPGEDAPEAAPAAEAPPAEAPPAEAPPAEAPPAEAPPEVEFSAIAP
mmetsp:Transcript_30111/g.65709  ORF Transcript_30111/g.65709 Transcript_30111/m.65709 type:complete len:409 (-) Transcript_30111:162-1388(-)